MTSTECPSDEDLAALVDRRTSGRARTRLLDHLDGCPSCFEIFVRSAELQIEHTEEHEFARPPRFTSHFWAAAATLFIAIGAGFGFWNLTQQEDGISVAQVMPHLKSGSGSGVLSDHLQDTGSNRFHFTGGIQLKEASFEAGVLVVDLAVNLDEGRTLDARSRWDSLHDLVPHMPSSWGSDSQAGDVSGAVDLERRLRRDLDANYFNLGLWTESGRLAARRESMTLFTTEPFREETRRLLGMSFPPEIQREIEAIALLIIPDGPALSDRQALEGAFSQIVLVSTRK
jgi:hypothetical protein